MRIEFIILVLGIVSIMVIIILPVEWFDKRLSLQKWKPVVSDTKMIQETILFFGPILREKGVRHYPTFKISYYHHPKFGGTYSNNKIVIYIKNNEDVIDLLLCLGHELAHHLQAHTNKQYSRYDEFTKAWGYYNNPFEYEARIFAHEWIEPCLKHLAEKGIIVKQ